MKTSENNNSRKQEEKSDNSRNASTAASLAVAYRELAPYLNIGYMFVASVVVLAFAGRWLDNRWETDPWLTVCGALLGMAVGFYQFFRVVLKSSRDRPNL